MPNTLLSPCFDCIALSIWRHFNNPLSRLSESALLIMEVKQFQNVSVACMQNICEIYVKITTHVFTHALLLQ